MSSVLNKSKPRIERESKEADNRLGLAASRLWLKVHTVSIRWCLFPYQTIKVSWSIPKSFKNTQSTLDRFMKYRYRQLFSIEIWHVAKIQPDLLALLDLDDNPGLN
jgi:hypothetical protein